jgi:hypothetical protein
MGLSFTIVSGLRQRSHSHVQVLRDSWPHFTVSDLRLPQPGGPCPHIYISQEQGGPVIPPGTGFPFCRLTGLQWRYSTLPPRHGPQDKHRLLLSIMRVYCPLPRNGCPSIVDRICFGNVFTESLPSNGHIHHNIYKHTHTYLSNTEVQFTFVPIVGSFTVIHYFMWFLKEYKHKSFPEFLAALNRPYLTMFHYMPNCVYCLLQGIVRFWNKNSWHFCHSKTRLKHYRESYSCNRVC